MEIASLKGNKLVISTSEEVVENRSVQRVCLFLSLPLVVLFTKSRSNNRELFLWLQLTSVPHKSFLAILRSFLFFTAKLFLDCLFLDAFPLSNFHCYSIRSQLMELLSLL